MMLVATDLNTEQEQAVSAALGRCLVLAGAGSGKTRVLVQRIAYLVEECQASPYSILAVTFTNKAANEMRGRLETILARPVSGMWVGTFHSLAHRLLRAHWQDVNLPQHFQILDSEDQLRLVKRLMKQLNVDDTRWPAKQIQWYINGKKDEGLRASHIDPNHHIFEKTMLQVYTAYEEACLQGGFVDFAELLLRCHELWLERPDILQHYRERFRHLLVDEFQDTNTIQYAWLRLLATDDTDIMIVGDDDQSIYGWRGAKIENILRFSQDFPDAKTIRLEQNYRSTGNILAASNYLIANNGDRLGKELWTEQAEGDPVAIYSAFNEVDEARFIVAAIQQWLSEGNQRHEVAILYRSNAQSRVLEEALMQAAIPYRVYGGLRFFERAEIKDALAYLRLLARVHDDGAFERVVNTPPRGIGERSIQQVRETARELNSSLWDAMQHLLEHKLLSTRALSALNGFKVLIEHLTADVVELKLPEQVEHMLDHSGLFDHYKKDRSEKGRAKQENLQELIGAAKQFERADDDDPETPLLTVFLAHAALEAGEGQAAADTDCVQMMTLHSAKGLEFPLVFIAGVEEGLFPHQMSLEEPGRLAEERRLCYVGMTRAMQKLYLTYAERRRLYGRENYHRPSRFINEIPAKFREEVRLRGKVARPTKRVQSFGHFSESGVGVDSAAAFRMGQTVSHPKFGEGIVLNFEGQGANARVQVQFSSAGSKWLMVDKANLESI